MSTHYFGAHTADDGGPAMAARRAGKAGMQALQIFTAKPTFYNEKAGIKPERVAAFRAALAEAGIEPRHVVVHAGYVLNTASPEPEKATKAAAALAKELERSTALGVGMVCFHPGSAGDSSREEAAARVGAAITQALTHVPDGATRLLIENTAGAGRTMGRTAEEVAMMLGHVPAALRARTGYGLDTCHLYASGHDLGAGPDAVTGILDAFQQATGEAPGFFHFNDSQGALASNKDRHMLLGEGTIGIEPFRWLLADPRTRGVPIVLETPNAADPASDDDDTPDANDVRMIALLRSLVG
ncbi:MAG: deoxyribonuclease IV [Gemmatimonadetes bacterium]|nr:deoxyribonuclease IV [Gemmatimonadota bacterium]